MDTFAALRLFHRIAETGGFSEAGRQLGLTPSAVSRQVAALENELGARLFNRSRNARATLTEAGQIYLAYANRIVDDLRHAREAVADRTGEPAGLLRVGAPIDLGQRHIAPLLPEFLRLCPKVRVELMLDDQIADFTADEIDLAIRIGKLRDSSLVARRIAPNKRVVCASPAYLEAHGEPRAPQDLRRHNCLTYKSHAARNVWRFREGEGIVDVRVEGTMATNNGHALLAAALGGLGIILQPEWMVAPDVAAGRLRILMPDCDASSSDISTAVYAVYPDRRHLLPRTRAFIDFVAGHFEAGCLNAADRPGTSSVRPRDAACATPADGPGDEAPRVAGRS